MLNFLTQHQFGAAMGIYWIFSAAVSAMPEPGVNSHRGYLWLYRFLHTTAGNITTALLTAARYRACASPGNRFPGLKTLALLLIVPLLLAASSCAAAHYTIHPGALNTADSAAYDTLLIAEATIDQARTAYPPGQVPAGARDALNILVQAYNVARESWLTYRGAIGAQRKRDSAQPQAITIPSDPYFQQLNKNLSDLTNAIRLLSQVKK